MFLIFDTETTGLPRSYSAPLTDFDNWPRLVQLAWQLHDHTGKFLSSGNFIVYPDGFTIPYNAEKVHGISTDRAQKEGKPLREVLEAFVVDLKKCRYVAGHNVEFDLNIVGPEFLRLGMENVLEQFPCIDTKETATDFCRIPGGRGGKFKWPTLTELHRKLFNKDFEDAHDAAADVEATTRCFFELIRLDVLQVRYPAELALHNPSSSYINREEYIDFVSPSRLLSKVEPQEPDNKNSEINSGLPAHTSSEVPKTDSLNFVHLHVHSKYSILQATADVKEIVSRAKEMGMNAVALTDIGNMFGAFFFSQFAQSEGIKPIIGCELYVVEDMHQKKFTQEHKDRRFLIPFLAKNETGYRNIAKLCSLGFTEGYYYKFPRVDKNAIRKYKEGVICLSGGISGEIADLILNKGIEFAEEAVLEWREIFGDDFYLELMNHGLDEEKRVNETLVDFSAKHGVELIASNNAFYLDREDADAHDALLCIDNGELQQTPIGRGRGYRYGFPNNEFYFKSESEMAQLFPEALQALRNTAKVADKIESIRLSREVILPNFELPENFISEDEYLAYLSMEGAKKRYGDINEEVKQRIEHELSIIAKMGFAGYFLIVQDFIAAARKMGVYVGPGRGSAAGSVVAYCTGIINIDPLEYDLLFERFLNPERVSMPDIDIDFDDEGRQKVIDYVTKKYGYNQVAHIITFGTMAARSSVRDVARVLDMPLPEADRLAKMVPERPGTTLQAAFKEVRELDELKKQDNIQGRTLRMAEVLEGSIRNTGIHAAGIIIAPDELTNFIPVATAKDVDLLATQFDGNVVESAGMLKMDFLGLKTLSILKTAIKMVKRNHGVEIDLDSIPLDDEPTFKLFQQGQTVGTFQFESENMRKHLKNLKPTHIDDLIAMNALYRPGPMQFIPDYIRRKHGQEEVIYDHDDLRDILEPTYGIMIYQEQIMMVSQRMADYTLGEADILRRIMGKKKAELLPPEQEKFIERAISKGYDKKTASDVFDKMAMFAGYGFNKSHSAAYSVIAFHTMYFKANYTAEYMASILSHNKNDIKKVSQFIEECQNLGIPVVPPDINSAEDLFVAKDRCIHYGMAAIKGVGEAAVHHIVEEREANGAFTSFFEFVSRIDLRRCNRKTLESLIIAGAFDCLNKNRASLMESLDDAISYANRIQEEKRLNQVSLFGDSSSGGVFSEPPLRDVPAWSNIERLKKERELIGFYLSGHPLDKHIIDISLFARQSLHPDKVSSLPAKSDVSVIAIITDVRRAVDKKGRPFAIMNVEDKDGPATVLVFSNVFDRFMALLEPDNVLLIEGELKNEEGKPAIIARNFERVENLREKNQERLQLKLNLKTEELTREKLEMISSLFRKNIGKTQVRLFVDIPSSEKPLMMNVRKFVVEPNDEVIHTLRTILPGNGVSLQKIQSQ